MATTLNQIDKRAADHRDVADGNIAERDLRLFQMGRRSSTTDRLVEGFGPADGLVLCLLLWAAILWAIMSMGG